MKRILPPVFLILCATAMALTQILFPIAQLVPWPANLVGALPILCGIGLASVSARQFSKVGTNIRTFDDPDKIVTTGLFAHTRNPMYLGFAIAAFGAAILAGSITPVAIAIIHLVVLDRWYIAFEEERMTEQFGVTFHAYKKRVRRWL